MHAFEERPTTMSEQSAVQESMSVARDGNVLVIRIPIEDPQPSQSGKTLIVATTHGFLKSGVKVANRQVSVSITATIKPPSDSE